MKGIGSKFRVHIRLHNDPHGGSWPYFKIIGSGPSGMKSVEAAFVALRDVANIAFQKIPVPNMGHGGAPSVSHGGAPSVSHGGAASVSHGGAPSVSHGGAPSTPPYVPTSPVYTPSSPGYGIKDPEPLPDPVEVERVTASDDKEYLVCVGDGAVRKVMNEEGEEIGVYIKEENKVHLN